MNSANGTIPPQPGTDPAAATAGAASLSDLALDTSDYVRAWSALFASETRLAGVSMMRLLYAALVLPAVALCICITMDVLLAAVLQRWLGADRVWAELDRLQELVDKTAGPRERAAMDYVRRHVADRT